MCIPPRKLAVVEASFHLDFVAGVWRNMEPEMDGVRGAGRNEAYVHNRSRSPRIPLVNRIAVRVDHERAIKMGALFDRPFAVVLDLAAPEEDLPFIVGRF